MKPWETISLFSRFLKGEGGMRQSRGIPIVVLVVFGSMVCFRTYHLIVQVIEHIFIEYTWPFLSNTTGKYLKKFALVSPF